MPLSRSELNRKMSEFYNSHQDAAAVLAAYSDVDPFQCYFGEDCNPDEYMGYAERYLKGEGDVLTRVRQSFYDSQLEEGWVTSDLICEIADQIAANT